MIVCRNVLFYFNITLQNQVLSLLSDSLCAGEFLIPGTKEIIQFSDVAKDFKIIDDKNKIYKKIIE